ncbi:hypothetical protein Fluta_4018 [Fluviicola taffensis DSM 16823]|uniref:Uncharacterized protein n=1 Tax=Fluviicola taffensis (strain DSM 16823 / NCIMB 13979 / RW262) TaxID=755732 RepID=F2IIL8_FLUTR|nr:hypothetical protein Fluta_4018 [Fluviicola taffensis DSM 16823]
MKKDNLPLIFNALKTVKSNSKKEGFFVTCSQLQTKRLELNAYYKKSSNFLKK